MAARPTEGPQKRSLEGPNSEIQKIVLTDTQIEKVSVKPILTQIRDTSGWTVALNLADKSPELALIVIEFDFNNLSHF